jgi:hypothetical protein
MQSTKQGGYLNASWSAPAVRRLDEATVSAQGAMPEWLGRTMKMDA